MFMNEALLMPYNLIDFFVPCDSWLINSADASTLGDSFQFISDECFYIGNGILWFCVFYRFRLLTLGEITVTNKKIFYIPVFTLAGLLLSAGVFAQAPVLLYFYLSDMHDFNPDMFRTWIKWSFSIHQPLISLMSASFDTVLSGLVLYHLYTHLNRRNIGFSSKSDNISNSLGFRRWFIQTLKSRSTNTSTEKRLVYFFISWISISCILIAIVVTSWIIGSFPQNYDVSFWTVESNIDNLSHSFLSG